MTIAMIGGEICKQRLASQLLAAEPRKLTRAEIDGLWRIFVAIGTVWKNTVHNSAGLKSSWLEFLTAKTMTQPSYVSEYVNALEVVAELIKIYGEVEAFENPCPSEVEVRAVLEDHVDHRETECGTRPHILDARQALEVDDHRVGHLVLDLLR